MGDQFWKERLEEIQRNAEFGDAAAAEEELLDLKREIQKDYVQRQASYFGKGSKIFKISIPIVIVLFFIIGRIIMSVSSSDTPIVVCGLIIATYIFLGVKIRQGMWKKIEEIEEFDKEHFDGEIKFKTEHGIRI